MTHGTRIWFQKFQINETNVWKKVSKLIKILYEYLKTLQKLLKLDFQYEKKLRAEIFKILNKNLKV